VSEELATIARVMQMTGCSRTRIYGEIKAGRFPAPLKVWGRSLWVVSEVQAWIQHTIATSPRMPVRSMGGNVGRKNGRKKAPEKQGLSDDTGGEGGIRTLGTLFTYA
jgi:prophage regulatory protein